MGFFNTDKEGWVESKGISSGGPYTLWKAPGMSDWYCVLDRNGTNVLSGGGTKDGAVFTSEEIAKAVMDRWNGN